MPPSNPNLRVVRPTTGYGPSSGGRPGYGTGTPWIATGPRVGSSSVPWSTVSGAITSIAFGAVPGSIEQIWDVPPGAHRPNWKSCGVCAKPRAWSAENPSCPCRTTAKVQPDVGVPSWATGSAIVIVRVGAEATTAVTDPWGSPSASCQTGPAKPCTSSRWLQAESSARVSLRLANGAAVLNVGAPGCRTNTSSS